MVHIPGKPNYMDEISL